MKLFKFLKDFLLYIGIFRPLSPLNNFFLFIRNFNKLRKWITLNNNENLLINDFYVYKRNYSKRIDLYKAVSSHFGLDNLDMIYLEFGVASGESFSWWVKHNTNPNSRFFGFDTFEGLPENWGGFYKKGDMSHQMTDLKVNDQRALFVKGTFQQTLTGLKRRHST